MNATVPMSQSIRTSMVRTDPVRDRLVRALVEGEVLFRQDDCPDAAFIVLSGEIKLFSVLPGGRLTIVGLCKSGDVVGHMLMARGEPATCGAYATKDTMVQVVGPDYFEEQLSDTAHVPPADDETGQRRGAVVADFVASHDRRRTLRKRDSGLARIYWGLRHRLAGKRRTLLLDDIEVVENRATPWQGPILLVVLVAIVGGAITWATYSDIDVVVTAEGRILPESGEITVAPLETGTLRSMNVRPGDVVRQGQAVATLDPTFAQSDLNKAVQEQATLEARINRLRAEISGIPPVRFSPNENLEVLNRHLYDTGRQAMAARQATFAARTDELQAELVTKRDELAAVEKQLGIYKDVEGMRSSLYSKDVGSKMQLLEAQGTNAALERDAVRFSRSIEELESRKATVAAESAVYVADLKAKAAQELEQAEDALAAISEDISKAERRANLVTLTAARDAVVLSVSEQAAGAVVQQGTPLVTMTPVGDELQVEALLRPEDVADVHVGQKVRIKLDALPFQKHGTLLGEVRVISPNIVTDRTAGTENLPEQERRVGYRVVVDIKEHDLKGVAKDFQLMPGMKAVAELQAGERSVISYFLYPVLRVFDESLRER